MLKNEITNQSNAQKKTLNNGSRNKFVKGLFLAVLVLMVSEIASATTLESQLDKIASSFSPKGYKRSVLGAIAASIGLILVMCQWWIEYCRPPSEDNVTQTSMPETTEDTTSQQSNKPTIIN